MSSKKQIKRKRIVNEKSKRKVKEETSRQKQIRWRKETRIRWEKFVKRSEASKYGKCISNETEKIGKTRQSVSVEEKAYILKVCDDLIAKIRKEREERVGKIVSIPPPTPEREKALENLYDQILHLPPQEGKEKFKEMFQQMLIESQEEASQTDKIRALHERIEAFDSRTLLTGPHENYETVLELAEEFGMTPHDVFTEWVYMGVGGSMIA